LRRGSKASAILAVAAGLAFGQNAAKIEFDAASLKPSGPQGVRMERRDPEMYSFSGATLWDLLFKAWDLVDYEQQIVGPGWLRDDSFDIIAHFPQGTAKEDFRAMLRNLLVERFGLVVHTETRDLRVYALVVGKNGPKLRESTGVPATPSPKGDDCFPTLPEGQPGIALRFSVGDRICLAAQQEPIAALADMLRHQVDHPIVDRTGLTGKYDVALKFGRRLTDQSSDTEEPDIFIAIRQLGLRLEPAKAPYEVLVVDHAERRPLDN
jgi:uncharacterized protein (TIGR03435 family)